MNNKERTEQSKKRIIDELNNEKEYKLIGGLEEYINNKSKLTLIHTKCSTQFEITGMKFLAGQRCNNKECIAEKISEKRRKTQEQFKKEIREKYGDEYQVTGKYINNTTKIEVYHKTCEKKVMVSAAGLLKGHGCSFCANTYKRNTKEFQDEIRKYTSELEVVGECNGRFHKIEVYHKTCGKKFITTPKSILKSLNKCSKFDGCPECAKNKKKDTEEFREQLNNKYGDEYEVVGEYINAHIPIEVKHNVCGKTEEHNPDALLSERVSCHFCKGTGGEKMVHYILEENLAEDCEYKPQKTLEGCKNKILLRFDVAVYKMGKLIFIIEYDGPGHDEPIYGIESLRMCQINDRIKNKYCKENKIDLLRVKYSQSRQEILDLILSKLIEHEAIKTNKCM